MSVTLSDFEGEASLYQALSVITIGYSWSSTLYLSIESGALLGRGARITPDRLLQLQTPSGFSSGSQSTGLLDVSAFTAGGINGKFKMVSGIRPFTGY